MEKNEKKTSGEIQISIFFPQRDLKKNISVEKTTPGGYQRPETASNSNQNPFTDENRTSRKSMQFAKVIKHVLVSR